MLLELESNKKESDKKEFDKPNYKPFRLSHEEKIFNSLVNIYTTFSNKPQYGTFKQVSKIILKWKEIDHNIERRQNFPPSREKKNRDEKTSKTKVSENCNSNLQNQVSNVQNLSLIPQDQESNDFPLETNPIPVSNSQIQESLLSSEDSSTQIQKPDAQIHDKFSKR